MVIYHSFAHLSRGLYISRCFSTSGHTFPALAAFSMKFSFFPAGIFA